MAGAIASHVLILGFVIMNDGGLLFSLALLVFILNLVIIFSNIDKIKQLDLTKPFTVFNQLSL
jgi:hypothetical protein